MSLPSGTPPTAPSIEHVRAAMRGPLPGPEAQVTMAPYPRPFNPPPGVEPRQAGVLLLFYPISTSRPATTSFTPSSPTHPSVPPLALIRKKWPSCWKFRCNCFWNRRRGVRRIGSGVGRCSTSPSTPWASTKSGALPPSCWPSSWRCSLSRQPDSVVLGADSSYVDERRSG